MPVAVGSRAPGFTLAELSGGTVSLERWLQNGPVLLAFFKTTCPTCMLAFPFLERIHQQAPGQSARGLRVLAISQDPAPATWRFHDDFETTMPTALDPADAGYVVSNAYAITHVPSLFLVSREGVVEWFSAGFSKPELEELGRLANVDVFTANDRVPVWKPG